MHRGNIDIDVRARAAKFRLLISKGRSQDMRISSAVPAPLKPGLQLLLCCGRVDQEDVDSERCPCSEPTVGALPYPREILPRVHKRASSLHGPAAVHIAAELARGYRASLRHLVAARGRLRSSTRAGAVAAAVRGCGC